ncbi:IreA family TonB-dependent siderophore receptor [Salmonella enterica]|nr:IreA family TonB-dependent siderophore receptor [Salmonella enterica]EHP8655564.1 IreA family TonB-dependent siderophore receptor [Salmonella enterica]EHQ6482415.1 IreA family TonB-dependent siderophore receptor [Salmonella enterica]EHR1127254.1 IreA family TonB-dependent siderophore receptor [Salmonella enterica]EIA1574997.1 IreA family TonB-dependent siderophore receptor [Salmonella enterica]
MYNMHIQKLHFSLFTLTMIAATTSAEAATQAEDTVVVTASGFEQQQINAPASVTVITADQLKKKPVSDLIDAVKGVEGVSIVGGNEKPDISIRGLGGDYTLILVDGRRQSGRESRPNGNGGFEAGFIPPVEAIERIEVIRGPMSSLYGSDAMGGVINIITKPFSKEWHGALGAGGIIQEHKIFGNSTTDDFYLSGPVIKDILGLQLYGGLNYRKEDAVSEGKPKRDNKNITATLSFTPTENQQFIFEAGRNNQVQTSTPGESIDAYQMRGSLKQQNRKRETHNERNHWVLSWNAHGDILNPEVSIYQEDIIRKIKQGKQDKNNHWNMAYDARRPEITNTVVDAKVTAFLPDNVLTLGGQFQYSKLRDDSATGKKTIKNESITAQQKALFAENEYSVTDALSLTGGLRLDNHEFYGTHWNPRAYAVYHLTDTVTVKGGIAKAFRAPSLREISPNFGTLTQGGASIMYGNRDLKPETSVTEELAIIYDGDNGYTASATIFNTDFKNKLTNYDINVKDPATGLNTFVYDNVGKANIRGVELAATAPIAESWKLTTNYTFTDSRRMSDDEKLNNKSLKGYPLERTPKHAANAKLEWELNQDLTLYTSGNYTGKQIWAAQRNGAKQPRIRKGLTTMDVGMNYQILPNALFNFSVMNVTDKKSEAINKVDGNWQVDEGRRYWANVRLSF